METEVPLLQLINCLPCETPQQCRLLDKAIREIVKYASEVNDERD